MPQPPLPSPMTTRPFPRYRMQQTRSWTASKTSPTWISSYSTSPRPRSSKHTAPHVVAMCLDSLVETTISSVSPSLARRPRRRNVLTCATGRSGFHHAQMARRSLRRQNVRGVAEVGRANEKGNRIARDGRSVPLPQLCGQVAKAVLRVRGRKCGVPKDSGGEVRSHRRVSDARAWWVQD